MGKKWYERPEPIPAEQIRGEVTADVVVVGLGYAGAAALRAAAEAGARVVGSCCGSTPACTGAIFAAVGGLQGSEG
mgnify:CR=1 FL=1